MIELFLEKITSKIKNKTSFIKKDEKLLLIYHKNQEYKKFFTNEILKFCKQNNFEKFYVSSYSSNIVGSCSLYNDVDFYLNLLNEVKNCKKSENENIFIFKDIDYFINDDKTIGLVEYINDFRSSVGDKTKLIVIMTNKRQTMKFFCKYEPTFLTVDFNGCLTEAACFDVNKKTPEEALKELNDDKLILGEINED